MKISIDSHYDRMTYRVEMEITKIAIHDYGFEGAVKKEIAALSLLFAGDYDGPHLSTAARSALLEDIEQD